MCNRQKIDFLASQPILFWDCSADCFANCTLFADCSLRIVQDIPQMRIVLRIVQNNPQNNPQDRSEQSAEQSAKLPTEIKLSS
jgi:hypothetical protein